MNIQTKRYSSIVTLSMLLFNTLIPVHVSAYKQDLVYPIKQISKLECRFEDFDTLSSGCKQNLPILKTEDYNKYAKKNGGYNDFTRIYTVLWGSSYKYGWDVGNGGHQGTDIATAKGTPVYSIADGKVIAVGNDIGWGKYVSIEHTIRGKKVVSNYAHLSKIIVNKGQSIDVSDKIGEVGSTGNSTGNHLHFQIDLPSSFHPYYYDWNACPYSYYDITEKGVCFNELAKNTFDPFAFLESNGAVLDEVQQVSSSSQSLNTSSVNSDVIFRDIFDSTVYYGYGTQNDVKQVQMIYKELGYYNGAISGNYKDIEESVIKYQLATGVLQNRNEDGAGWFGPKTRKQTRKDYDDYLASGKITRKVVESTESTVKTQKIATVSRANLLTREEIEAREIDDFMRENTVRVKNTYSQLNVGDTKVSQLSITTKRGRGYKGNTPGAVTFEYDESKISVFPKSFFNFVDGKRDISVTGLAKGSTTLKVKIGSKVIHTYSLTVGAEGETRGVQGAQIYTPSTATLGSTNTAIVLMKDSYGNKLVKTQYSGNFDINTKGKVEYCVKRGSLGEIRSVYKRDCRDDEYTDTLSFDYDDTIAGLLIFDYRVQSDGAVSFDLKSGSNSLSKKTVTVAAPKGLTSGYPYYQEVVASLKEGVSETGHGGYFYQDRGLTKLDAAAWLERSLQGNTTALREQKVQSMFDTITRGEFIDLAAAYTGNSFSGADTNRYRDLEGEKETLVVSLLGSNYTWKDQFGEYYFQPDKVLTRGEATYILEALKDKKQNNSVARR